MKKIKHDKTFLLHLKEFLFYGFLLVLIHILVGIAGYYYFAELSLIDAFLNASMIIGGMGQISELKTDGAKLFAAIYALFSGLIFFTIMTVLITPILRDSLSKIDAKK